MKIEVIRVIGKKDYINEIFNIENDINSSIKKYDHVYDFKEGLAKIEKDGKWGFIDKEGKEVIKIKYDKLDNFIDNFCIFEKHSFLKIKKGCIDKEGKEIFKPREIGLKNLGEGLFRIYKNHVFTIVDKTGKKISKNNYNSVEVFHEGLAVVEKLGKYGFINKEGKEVIRLKYDHVYDFKEGLSAVRKNNKWGFIDKEGNEIIELKYDDVYDFKEGLSAVRKNNKWGFIDKEGNEIIELKYDDVEDFKEGLAVVKKDVKHGLIDNKGRIVADFISDQISMNNAKITISNYFKPVFEVSRQEISYDVLIKQGDKIIERKFNTPEEQNNYYNIIKIEVDKENEEQEKKIENFKKEIEYQQNISFEKIVKMKVM